MSIATEMAGTWVRDEDMDPATNVSDRKWWAPSAAVGDNLEGTYRGHWPTQGGFKPQGLYWFFPPVADTSKEPREGTNASI